MENVQLRIFQPCMVSNNDKKCKVDNIINNEGIYCASVFN